MPTRVKRMFTAVEESIDVTAAVVSTGWVPGHAFKLNGSTGYGEPADGTEFYGIVLEDELDLELGSSASAAKTFPETSYTTGPLAPAGAINKVTLCHGSGTLLQIDSALPADNTALWDSSLESASYNDAVYLNAGVYTTTTYTGAIVVGWVRQPPTAANGYQFQIKLHI